MHRAQQSINLGVSVDEEHRGLKNLDFFTDHASKIKDMRYTPYKASPVMGPLYLRTALTTITCPRCNEKVKRNIKHRPMEWILRFAGRKVLYCTSCDWKQIVKEGRWEWETVATACTALLIVGIASIVWIIR